jgi:hypothetical protein
MAQLAKYVGVRWQAERDTALACAGKRKRRRRFALPAHSMRQRSIPSNRFLCNAEYRCPVIPALSTGRASPADLSGVNNELDQARTADDPFEGDTADPVGRVELLLVKAAV